jgi:DNA-binding SARP family transcriptional activator
MSRLTIHLLGRLQVCRESATEVAIEGAKAQELLAYLLVHRRRAWRREALAEVLWPETPTAQAKKYFRQTLWQLQTALDEGSNTARTEHAAVLLVDLEWLRINPAADLWLDIAQLESVIDQCQGIAGHDLTESQAEAVREGVQVYIGDLLEAWPQEWCLYERERLAVNYLQLLEKLMGFCEARQRYDEAIEYGGRILRTDRARERTHRRLMRLHYLAGDRAEALRQFARCRDALRDELDVEPSARTKALRDEILADQVQLPVEDARAPTEIDAAVVALRLLLDGFDAHVRSALEQLERLAQSRV